MKWGAESRRSKPEAFWVATISKRPRLILDIWKDAIKPLVPVVLSAELIYASTATSDRTCRARARSPMIWTCCPASSALTPLVKTRQASS